MKLKELKENKELLEELIATDGVPDDEKKIYKESLSNINQQIEEAETVNNKFKVGELVAVKASALAKNPTYKTFNKGNVIQVIKKDGDVMYDVEASQDLSKSLFYEKELLHYSQKDDSKPKKMLKKDFYAEMDAKFPDTKYNELKDLPQKDYDTKMKLFAGYAQRLGAPKDYTLAWIERHIPKGKSQEAEKIEALSHSWKTPSKASEMKPFVLHCQQYYHRVEKQMRLKIKGTGDESIDVIAKKGEYLIFDDNRQLVFVMTAEDFKRKCIERTTIEEHYAANHKSGDIEKVQEENKSLQEEIKSLKEKQSKMAEKQASPSPKKEESPSSGNKTSDKKQEGKPKAAKPNPKRKAVCTLKEAEIGRRVQRITKFFVDHAEKWKNSKTTKKITKIYRTKGDKQEIIVEMADYKGFVTGLQAMIGGKRKYYRLCVDSFTLTTTSKPAQGTYRLVVKEADMKRIYTTKGDEKYAICLKTYRELLKCSFEGKCTAAQSAKWKTLHQECGDLIIKLEKQPEIMRNFHAEVRNRRRKGESYNQAAERTAKELKAEAKK